MAKIWPSQFPPELAHDPRRSAESQVFTQLQNQLPDDYEVYYSRPWWGLDNDGQEKHGEADFIVAHAELGLLFLEVKGGRIAFDPKQGRWTSTDRNGITHRIKDPVDQATKSLHGFLSRFKQDSLWPKHYVNMTIGVLLPDSTNPPANKQTIGMHPKELFMFNEDFSSGLLLWVSNRLRKSQDLGKLGAGGLQAVRRIVADATKLSFALPAQIQGEIAEQDSYLLGIQHLAIQQIFAEDRVVVEGGAGTGKSVVAMELGKRWSQLGYKTVFIAKNEQLVKLAEKLIGPSVFCRMWHDDLLSDLNHLGVTHLVVDEAQDLDHVDLSKLHTPAQFTKLAVFCDSNQAIYNNPRLIAERLEASTIRLSVNLRNTRAIGQVAMQLYDGPAQELIGPIGESPKTIVCATGLINSEIINLCKSLLTSGLSPSRITILCDSIDSLLSIRQALQDAHIDFSRFSEWQSGSVILEMIENFKGLESDCVIIAISKPERLSQEIAYVAASRARSRLFVVSTAEENTLLAAVSKANRDE